MADSLGIAAPSHQDEPEQGPELVRDELGRAPYRGSARISATRSHRLRGFGLVILATMCFSTSGIFIKGVMQGGGVNAIGLAFWRVTVTFACLLVGLAVLQPRLLRVRRRDLPWLAGLGALAMGTFQVLWILSVLTNGVSIATVIQCTSPVLVTLLAWVIWREALTWRKWGAIALTCAGTCLVAGLTSAQGLQVSVLGLLIALGSALAYAGITLFTKKLAAGAGYNSWTILTYGFGFASLALLLFQFGRPLPEPAGWQAYGAFAALVLIPTIGGYTFYTQGLRHLQASVASITGMAEVPFAAFNGYVFLGERLDALQALGALIVMGGVALLSWPSRRTDK
jgi:drug/metabolite transporter (DMT)-like permease